MATESTWQHLVDLAVATGVPLFIVGGMIATTVLCWRDRRAGRL